MANARKQVLPKDFTTLLVSGDVEELKAVFESIDVNARDRVSKVTTLALDVCPDELARWLVEQGADLEAVDAWGNTPLHTRARHWRGDIQILLELGADLDSRNDAGCTPLHAAADACNFSKVRLLVEHGAGVNALNNNDQAPLAYALERCTNSAIEEMATIAAYLLQKGTNRAPEMKEHVASIGTRFEFHRGSFNPDSLDATQRALERLYALFEVSPAPPRTMHDGMSPIILKESRWQDQHRELWDLLVPSQGPALTVQGEVIRISGRIDDEIQRNGGANWDVNYTKMANAFLKHVASGIALPDLELESARQIVAQTKRRNSNTDKLCELAVVWVVLNPVPARLLPPDYSR